VRLRTSAIATQNIRLYGLAAQSRPQENRSRLVPVQSIPSAKGGSRSLATTGGFNVWRNGGSQRTVDVWVRGLREFGAPAGNTMNFVVALYERSRLIAHRLLVLQSRVLRFNPRDDLGFFSSLVGEIGE
jgi:hypothetical protein